MTIEEIKKKVEEVRSLIISTEINPTTYDYYDKLLDIERKLWDLMYFKQKYFKQNQEENWLRK